MTYFKAQDMTDEDRDVFVQWIRDEGLDPDRIIDNGRLSVFNGRVTWFEFITRDDGSRVRGVSVPHLKEQENPLPERFL